GNGQSVTVTYTVRNAGTDAAQGTWDDAIYLSSKQTYDSSATLLGSIYQYSRLIPKSLAAGASYTVSQTVSIPDFAPLGGDFLLVQTNELEGGQYAQAETDQANDTNNLAAVPITLTAPGVNLAISASASTTPTSSPLTVEAGNGQQLNLSWTVTNNGTADANSTWTDHVFLAQDANFDNFDHSATSLVHSSEPGLAAGASYTENHTVIVPNLPAGNRDLVFVTDQYDNQSETRKTDNLATQPVVVTTPNVNLAIAGTAASSVIEGDTIPVSWTVTNNGSEAAKGSWSDAVYLSNDPTLDDTAVRLTTVAAPTDALLPAGGHYTQTANVTIPASTTGPHYLLFVANEGQTQGETNYANDVTAAPISLSAPDLKLQSATVTPSTSGTVIEGGQTSVSWTVDNNSAVAAPADWFDSVFVSDQPSFDGSTKYITSFDESSHAGLAANASYTDSSQIAVPQFPTGTAYLLFVTDLGKSYLFNYGFGHGQPQSDSTGFMPDGNDVQAAQVTLAAPDLSVTAATAPFSTIVEGGSVNVSWTVQDLSASTPAQSSWYDSVYVSSKPTFDSSAVLLQSFDESTHSGLAAGASYTDSESVAIPQFATGSEYLLFVTDFGYGSAGQPQSDGGTAPDANDVK
ncbi:MAG TPA: CARDB domain-containing protein, partial [Pirellulales bacterium]|nr:CARDB domain-containing protein [Pirellulales bacterium]